MSVGLAPFGDQALEPFVDEHADMVSLGPALEALNIDDFLSLDIPVREKILDPVLPTKGLGMVFGSRGLGKTHFGVGVALASSSGGQFLKWKAPKPRKVLMLDGEMPAGVLQE